MPVAAHNSAKGKMVSTDCVTSATSDGEAGGCSFVDNNNKSFGEGFKNAGGGVFATRWDQNGIALWRFPRSSIPKDITARKPKPSQWGPPVANFPSTECDIESHFINHSLVLDITLCGYWAGIPSVYSSTCPGSCAQAVADPSNFKSETFWMSNIDAH